MTDRRQTGIEKRTRAVAEKLCGKWEFFKEDLTTGEVKELPDHSASLEISNEQFHNRNLFCHTRSSVSRKPNFTQSYLTTDPGKDVDWFSPLEELKRGAKLYTPKAVYFAVFTPPVKRKIEVEPVLKIEMTPQSVIAELMRVTPETAPKIFVRGKLLRVSESVIIADLWKGKSSREVTFGKAGVKYDFHREDCLFELPAVFETIYGITDLILTGDELERVQNHMNELNAPYLNRSAPAVKIDGFAI